MLWGSGAWQIELKHNQVTKNAGTRELVQDEETEGDLLLDIS